MRHAILAIMILAGCQPSGRVSPEPAPPVESAAPASGGNTEPGTREESKPARAEAPVRPNADDDGIFSDLDEKVELRAPKWVDLSAAVPVGTTTGDVYLVVDGVPVALASSDIEPEFILTDDTGDVDDDSIPDSYDLLVGAAKTALNGSAYGSPYREVEFPGGDVPRNEGVCTDTLVRAVRNAGRDIQAELYRDIGVAPRSFPMVKERNTNIDHRRVKTLLPYFERRWVELSPAPTGWEPWLPGDIVFQHFAGDARPDHVGVVADRRGPSNAPLLINNYTDGYNTSALDIAEVAPVTHRFRIDADLGVPEEHRGLGGVLTRSGLSVPDDSSQFVLVTVRGWDTAHGELRRFERKGGGFVEIGRPWRITVGHAGLGVGRGIVSSEKFNASGPAKSEGDGRAPAGVFRLGTSFGKGARGPGTWDYRQLDADDRFVDDVESRHYNRWADATGDDDWSSAEEMSMYQLGLVVHHNHDDVVPGAGSAIFLHTWQGEPRATLGCTAMKRTDLHRLIGWLDSAQNPVLVQVPGSYFEL